MPSIEDAVRGEDRKATEAYISHMDGLGYEFLENAHPHNSTDECIRQIWKMACFTYFPRCDAVSPEKNKYVRPCSNGCWNYVQKCNVQCCDEGVQCSFEHETILTSGESFKTKGYPDIEGPSALCTGSANSRYNSGWKKLLLLALFLGVIQAAFSQYDEHAAGSLLGVGCDAHTVRLQPRRLTPGSTADQQGQETGESF
jgi:hypothetical protein